MTSSFFRIHINNCAECETISIFLSCSSTSRTNMSIAYQHTNTWITSTNLFNSDYACTYNSFICNRRKKKRLSVFRIIHASKVYAFSIPLARARIDVRSYKRDSIRINYFRNCNRIIFTRRNRLISKNKNKKKKKPLGYRFRLYFFIEARLNGVFFPPFWLFMYAIS